MRYINLKQQLQEFTIFSIADIMKIDANFHRRRLNEWQDKNYIKKVVKGYYIFSDLKLNESALFEIANRIYNPSYVSFEAAISYYGLIPEAAYGITSVSTRRTYRFRTTIAEFSYRTLTARLFFGYNIIRYNGKAFKIASPEKAILDYLYLHEDIKSGNDYAAMRINKGAFFNTINRNRLKVFLKKFGHKTLTKRVNSFLEFIKYD